MIESANDDTCKLAVPKKTVRNIINNPWITDSIISAIDKKDYLYTNLKSTCTKKDPDGDRSIHKKIYSDYRRILKHIISDEKSKYHDKKLLMHIISDEKSKYHDKKIVNALGDPKKTWLLINQLRGKQRGTIKPVFIIDNGRIINHQIVCF